MNRRAVIRATGGIGLLASGLLPKVARADELDAGESGATGDGWTDDLDALQGAVDELTSDADTLTLPEGEFLITGPVFVDGKSDLTIRGAGASRTTIRVASGDASPALWVGGAEPVARVTLADLSIASDVAADEGTLAGEVGALLGDVDTVVFEDVAFRDLDGNLHVGISGRLEVTLS